MLPKNHYAPSDSATIAIAATAALTSRHIWTMTGASRVAPSHVITRASGIATSRIIFLHLYIAE